jgi:hypothetical protein
MWNLMLDVNFMLMTSITNTRWSMTDLSWNRLMKSSFWWGNLRTLIVLPDKFMVGGIISKLPPSWKYFSTSLKHKKESMTIESLIVSLDVEEKAKLYDLNSSSMSIHRLVVRHWS